MRLFLKLIACCLSAGLMMAQSDRGTITGTVSDPSGAFVAAAMVAARNLDTGTKLETVTTGTGSFTLASVPVGPYEVVVEAPGFSRSVQTGITVQVALTVRLDVTLRIGSITDTIEVVAESPLLRTENAESSVNVTGDRINSLPLNFGGGAGAIGAIRNQMAFAVLSPGVSGSGTGARINGFAGNTFRVMIDGQDSTSGNSTARVDETQASVEAVEEFTLQTSNFSAEYGQALGGVFNFSIRSGTNSFHGSAYEYFTNEALNARQPLAQTSVLPVSRKNDFGFTLGGPLRIPKVYNGKDKTFYFFNWEYFRNKIASTGIFQTLPTTEYRSGNFAAGLTNRNLATDGLGRPIMENAVYDPLTNQTVNGQIYRNAFLGNVIPASRLDPVAVAIQKYIPAPINSSLSNNWQQNGEYIKSMSAPAFKLDHNFGTKMRVSYYFGNLTNNQRFGFDSLPDPITAGRVQAIYSRTNRLNVDYTLTPTTLLHLGAGYIRYINPDRGPPGVMNFDAAKEIGFTGSATDPGGFPRITNLATGTNNAFGGMSLTMGPQNANLYYNDKATGVASLTIASGNHSYKMGAELRIDSLTDRNTRGAQGVLDFNRAQTGLPATQGIALPAGTGVGLNYASFMLGLTNSTQVNAIQDPQWRKTAWGLYVQDTWKVTRKLTVDYGLRWDLQPAGHEIWDRVSTLGFNTPNPSVGGRLGGMTYAGYGQGRCNCDFTPSYKAALGPRLGVAYQIDSKTVLRGGWGLSYGNVTPWNYITNSVWTGVSFNSLTFNAPGAGDAATLLRNGLQYNRADLYATTLDPGGLPLRGQTTAPAVILDASWARPPRVNQWTIGIQREINRSLVIEAAYVGNRTAWLNGPSMTSPNAISFQRLAAAGIDLSSAADRTLLTTRNDSAAVAARGFRLPYDSFAGSNTLAQALRPFAQFSSGLSARNASLGKSWYDSLQVKATQRFNRGLDATFAFTWAKDLDATAGSNDVFNRPNQKRLTNLAQPLVLTIGFNYETQKWFNNRALSFVTSGWTLGGLLRYSSGTVIGIPLATNLLNSQVFQNTFFNRVSGQQLFTKDLNCDGCIDPNKDLVLNAGAWVNPDGGKFGVSSAAYNDYRSRRTPDEQLSIGRSFRISEGKAFMIRAEFFNVFNRTVFAAPTSGTPAASTTCVLNSGATASGAACGDPNTLRNLTAGQGFINMNNSGQPRNGQLVGRFTF
ncbi:MAG: TonB-dependent receptor [Bryobacteraceae bacterium]